MRHVTNTFTIKFKEFNNLSIKEDKLMLKEYKVNKLKYFNDWQ